MKAILLVGGEGTRLRPLTYFAPKQMLPIVGVTMLERVMSALASHGVTEAVLSLGYLPHAFMDAFPHGTVAGVSVTYAVEPSPLDTAGAIGFAARHADIDDTFLVVNGDVLTDLDVSALVNFHRERGAEATIALHPVEDPSRFGVVPTHPDGRVIAFIEKPPRDEAPTNLINAGTYVCEPAILDRIPQGQKLSVERVVFPQLVADDKLFALADDTYWLDTGTPAAYLQANKDVLDGRRRHGAPSTLSGSSWIAPSATIATGSVISGSVIDRDCAIASDVQIINSVLFPGVRVAPGARIVDSIVGPQVTVGEHSYLGPTCVIGRGETISPRSSYEGDVRIGVAP
jgi:mannose-1-phosphate guanylyltransferase